MKKIIAVNSILVMTLLFVGCGSSSDDSPISVDEASSQGKSARLQNISAIFNNNRNAGTRESKLSLKKKLSKYESEVSSKTEDGTYECIIAGEYTVESFTLENRQFIKEDNSKCQYKNNQNITVSEDGIFIYSIDSGDYISYFSKYTYVPDVENEPDTKEYMKELYIQFFEGGDTSTNEGDGLYAHGDIDIYNNAELIEKSLYTDYRYIKEKNSKGFSIFGKMSSNFKCFSENYEYETISPIFPHDSNPNYYKLGTIKINDTTYTYDGENITLSENGKVDTFTQQQFLQDTQAIRSNSECSNPNQLSKVTSTLF